MAEGVSHILGHLNKRIEELEIENSRLRALRNKKVKTYVKKIRSYIKVLRLARNAITRVLHFFENTLEDIFLDGQEEEDAIE